MATGSEQDGDELAIRPTPTDPTRQAAGARRARRARAMRPRLLTLAAGLTVLPIAVLGTNPTVGEALVAGAAASAAAAVAARFAARRRRERPGD